MIRLIDVTYYTHLEYDTPEQILHHHKESLGYIHYLKDRMQVQVIKHLNYEGVLEIDGTKISFLKSRNKFFHIPLKTHRYIKSQNPDIMIVQGLVFPVQLIFLKMLLGKQCHFLVQHHGETPFKGVKGLFQRLADYFIDGYLFTAAGNIHIWKQRSVIKQGKPDYEVLEAATHMTRQDKAKCQASLGINSTDTFLWVGRLEGNKDPITVLLGFEKYAKENPSTCLYMIYQETDLLAEVQSLIKGSHILSATVHLVGKVTKEELPTWFSAADFYLSGSHKEAAGFALIESMTCGCIPIVTDIPPFRKITNGYGLLYSPGNADDLYAALKKTKEISKENVSAAITRYAQQKLSFKSIAEDIYKIARDITRK
ncbi:MAG: glycosyltransferase family 4 protein [Flavipsychrobacter sp.]|nr:glycosyltransferase family 4 protein [Flavipsychrobacter sp.]